MNLRVTKNPEFLMELGMAYLDRDLLDAAAEVLVQIPQEHPLYVDAALELLRIHDGKRNYQEVIRLGENLAAKGTHSSEVSRLLGVAYYRTRQLSTAKKHFWIYLATCLPDNNQIQAGLKSLRAGSTRPKVKPLIRECDSLGITPHAVLDGLAPILWDGRPSTCCFRDQFMFFSHVRSREAFLMRAVYLYERFGIYTAFLRYVCIDKWECVPLGKLYFSRQPTIFAAVSEIEQLAWKEFEYQGKRPELFLEYMKQEGAILGYPECCVRWALKIRRLDKSKEDEALKTLMMEEYACMNMPHKILSPKFAYFAFEFYPCSPRCAAAEKIGENLSSRYKQVDAVLFGLYNQHILPLNKARIWEQWERFGPYHEFITSFNEQMYAFSRTFWQKVWPFSRG